MKGKLFAFMLVFCIVFIWLIFSFVLANIAVSYPPGEIELTFEQYFIQFLTEEYVIVPSVLLGSIAGVYVYCQASDA